LASFDPAFDFLMSNEDPTRSGKVLDDPRTGEYSRFGITLKTAALLGLCRSGDKSWIDQLTEGRARSFYFSLFWETAPLERIVSQDIASKIFDMAVNMCPRRAAIITQRVCKALGRSLAIDGVLGVKTVNAINAVDSHQLRLELRAESVQYYANLVASDPGKYAKYFDGWKERAEK